MRHVLCKICILQFSDNKDIGLIFIYEINSSCIFASSFAVLDIIFSALILYLDLYSIAILDTNLLVEYYIYFVCVCEFTNHFFLSLPWNCKLWLIFTTFTP